MSAHILLTPDECQGRRRHDPDATNCPVCDWGLGVCKNCGRAEVELSDHPECSMTFFEPLRLRYQQIKNKIRSI